MEPFRPSEFNTEHFEDGIAGINAFHGAFKKFDSYTAKDFFKNLEKMFLTHKPSIICTICNMRRPILKNSMLKDCWNYCMWA